MSRDIVSQALGVRGSLIEEIENVAKEANGAMSINTTTPRRVSMSKMKPTNKKEDNPTGEQLAPPTVRSVDKDFEVLMKATSGMVASLLMLAEEMSIELEVAHIKHGKFGPRDFGGVSVKEFANL